MNHFGKKYIALFNDHTVRSFKIVNNEACDIEIICHNAKQLEYSKYHTSFILTYDNRIILCKNKNTLCYLEIPNLPDKIQFIVNHKYHSLLYIFTKKSIYYCGYKSSRVVQINVRHICTLDIPIKNAYVSSIDGCCSDVLIETIDNKMYLCESKIGYAICEYKAHHELALGNVSIHPMSAFPAFLTTEDSSVYKLGKVCDYLFINNNCDDQCKKINNKHYYLASKCVPLKMSFEDGMNRNIVKIINDCGTIIIICDDQTLWYYNDHLSFIKINTNKVFTRLLNILLCNRYLYINYDDNKHACVLLEDDIEYQITRCIEIKGLEDEYIAEIIYSSNIMITSSGSCFSYEKSEEDDTIIVKRIKYFDDNPLFIQNEMGRNMNVKSARSTIF